ncbi:MAG TPA: hypothetical protein VL401_00815 [Alphaproteobacteria bacterium]|jgi:hypothetical protein|nr:hypothetical protein [Alphaproteobacteria bacterium]
MLNLRKLLRWLESNFWDIAFVLILLILTSFIAFQNYTPNTWLSGWDNLHPEFDFSLNVQRSFSAVWQEYQGVGVLGGMSHAAAISRELILWGFSSILPASFLRYFWTFAMFTIGPLGVYFLMKALVSKSFPAFAGAMFYIFNLATVQTFFTPFETFVSFYGFLPWLLLVSKRRSLIPFVILSFLATSAFYVQTLFIVYVVFLTIISLPDGILRTIKILFVTFIVNAFWLLPVLYFTLTSGNIPANSHINSIATSETQIMNQARGDFKNIASLKGFWFDYYDWDKNGKYDYLYKDWISHANNPLVTKISLSIFIISVLGLILSRRFSWAILFGISYFMLTGGKISWIPLFNEIFRNSFTKWGNAMALIYAVGLGSFISFLNKKIFIIPISILIISASIFCTFPIFQGKLISQSMRVNIPQEYFDLFKFMQTVSKTKRIANFPMLNFWGWDFYKWGYKGSGFLWYGIPQPILDRAFDVWSPQNEAFYMEANFALNYGTPEDFQKILEKYQISYVLFDDAVYDPANNNSDVVIQKQKKFIESLPNVGNKKNFGTISLYEFKLNQEIQSFVSAPKFLTTEMSYVSADRPAVSETFPDNQGYKEAKNCDLKNQGQVTKKKLEHGNYYAAYNGGVSCDYFYYPTLDYSQSYTMRIQGNNISGRSLKIYLFNVASNNIDLEELLPAGKFDKSFLILAKEKDSARRATPGGYTLNLETRSFGKVGSENEITDIEFYPANVIYPQDVQIQNNLKIQNVQKYGTWGYKIDVEREGLLQLSQGYNEGWITYPRLQHLKVNGWENGWLVPSTDLFNYSSIYLIYWPQILEWGGMILSYSLTFGLLYGIFFYSKKG